MFIGKETLHKAGRANLVAVG
eukprot:SAG31_NODE_25210_length_466_cov_0.566757_1_plen_20_part_10